MRAAAAVGRSRSRRNADNALRHCPDVRDVVVVRHTGGDIDWVEGRDTWYHEVCAAASPDCPPEEMSAEDPLSSSFTLRDRPDSRKGCCTPPAATSSIHQSPTNTSSIIAKAKFIGARPMSGWVTGHSYIVYGPLSNGATTLNLRGRAQLPGPPRGSGRSSISTTCGSSIPRRPQSAH